MNPHKGMILYGLWLTPEEEKALLENIKIIPSLAWSILLKAMERGDFEKR